MPKTSAERQQAWRQRRTDRIAALETEAAQLRTEAGILRAGLPVFDSDVYKWLEAVGWVARW
jgi:hypothetical protein